jgi:hypothetical protein
MLVEAGFNFPNNCSNSLEQDALNESVDEMKELLQSWYRSFSFVSRLQNAVKH